MSRSEPGGPDLAQLGAIVAAVELVWPRPVTVAPRREQPPPWRFSGRWWFSHSPVAAQRRRP